tara:strand:+ start:310 stop:1203 length:894 start_codon:yes stop_codon:yes gene_type:complete
VDPEAVPAAAVSGLAMKSATRAQGGEWVALIVACGVPDKKMWCATMEDDATKQCTSNKSTKYRCKQMIPMSSPFKLCHKCRTRARKSQQSIKGNPIREAKEVKRRARARSKPVLKKYQREYYHKWKNTATGKKSLELAAEKHAKSDKTKISRARNNKKLMNKLSVSLHSMLGVSKRSAHRIRNLGTFVDNDDVTNHFTSTFQDWMTIENHGKYRKGDAYRSKWNIGHRLPKAIFDATNVDDLKKCWSRDNLFAQCAKENVEQQHGMFTSDVELLLLKHIWPKAANNDLEMLKLLYRA